MRAAASGMSREDGFAAMKIEADELKVGKPPKEVGFIEGNGNAFRARVQFKVEGTLRHIPGPWRPDEEAAEEDLQSIRNSAIGMSREDGYAAMKIEADRMKAGKTLSVEQVDRKGTLTSALFAHRPENSCLRHAPFSATEPGD